MNNEQREEHLIIGPIGILTAHQTAMRCACLVSDLPVLAKIGALKPLAWPLPQNATRTYAKIEVDRYLNSIADMTKARKALLKFHDQKNRSRKNRKTNNEQEG